MGQQKVDTLQIKNWKGIDRFTEGTERQPDLFEKIQNFNIPNPGEAKAINGVTRLADAIPDLDSIIHTKFIDTPKDKGLVVFYRPNTTMIAAPVAGNFAFATSGGGAVARNVWAEYVVQGGGRIGTDLGVQSIEANGLTITLPNLSGAAFNVVQCVNIQVNDSSGRNCWAGSAWRETNNQFPATMVVYAPGAPQAGAMPSIGLPVGSFLATPGYNAAAKLESGRTYYLGIGPWFASAIGGRNGYAEVAYKLAATGTPTIGGIGGEYFATFLPDGQNKIDFTFDYCALNPSESETTPLITELAMSRAVVYCGVTPEDLMPASNLGVGYSSTIGKTTTVSPDFNNTTDVDDAADIETITVASGTGLIPVGACLKYIVRSGVGIGGLTANAYYFVVSSTYTTIAGSGYSIIKLGLSPGGTKIPLTDAVGTSRFEWATYSGSIYSLPKSCNVIAACGSWATNKQDTQSKAIAGRGVGVVQLRTAFTPSALTTSINQIACGIFTSLDLSFANFRHIPIPLYQISPNLVQYNTQASPPSQTRFQLFLNELNSGNRINWEFESRQYGNRLWVVNSFNEPFYTNGYILKAICPSDNGSNTFSRPPITSFIEFYKDRMVLASKRSNQTYQEGYAYFSKLATGFGDVQDFSFNSTTPNVVSVNTSDQSAVNGLNIYSQDLTSVGAESFLVIGKEASVFTWDGNVANPAKQIAKATGFAGPRCYSVSKFGPVYVGRDNVYLFRSSQDVVPVGDSIKDIILGLSSVNLAKVNCMYHDDDIKIGYTDTTDLDREIWLRFQYRSGELTKHWSGPHTMKSYKEATSILSFNGERDVRVSHVDNKIYRRDDPGSFLNDGSDPLRAITISNLGLDMDHFLKLIWGMNLALKTEQDEDFDITLESEDGSQSIVVQTTAEYSGNMRKMKQVQFPQRFLARVLKLTIENTAASDISIYDFSILFQKQRRRLLP